MMAVLSWVACREMQTGRGCSNCQPCCCAMSPRHPPVSSAAANCAAWLPSRRSNSRTTPSSPPAQQGMPGGHIARSRLNAHAWWLREQSRCERAEQVWPAWLAGSGQSRVSSTKAAQRGMHTCCQVAPAWLYVEVHALVGAPALPLNAVHHACRKTEQDEEKRATRLRLAAGDGGADVYCRNGRRSGCCCEQRTAAAARSAPEL